jgi:hypothetical protein
MPVQKPENKVSIRRVFGQKPPIADDKFGNKLLVVRQTLETSKGTKNCSYLEIVGAHIDEDMPDSALFGPRNNKGRAQLDLTPKLAADFEAAVGLIGTRVDAEQSVPGVQWQEIKFGGGKFSLAHHVKSATDGMAMAPEYVLTIDDVWYCIGNSSKRDDLLTQIKSAVESQIA